MKKTLPFMLCCMLLFALCACGQKDSASPAASVESASQSDSSASETFQSDTSSQTEDSDQAIQNNPMETATPEPTIDPLTQVARTDEYILTVCNTYSLPSRNFYDGVAWVTMKKAGTNEEHVGLINESGEIIYFVNQDQFAITNTKIAGFITTPFINGLSAIYAYQSGNAADSLPGFILLNSKGEEVYTCSDENVYMIGQAPNGNYILLYHDSGFDHDDWKIQILDSSLRLVDTNIIGNSSIRSQVHPVVFITDGVYILDNQYFLNTWLNAFFDVKNYVAAYNGTSDKYTCFGTNSQTYIIPNEMLVGCSSADVIRSMATNSDESQMLVGSYDGIFSIQSFKPWKSGSFYHEARNTREYIDVNGNVIMSYPTFLENVEYFSIDDFAGGYSAIYLIGADGDGYITVVNEAGDLQYEPIHCDGFNQYTFKDQLNAMSYNGYIFCQLYSKTDNTASMMIVDPQGHQKQIGDDLTGLAGSFYCSCSSFAMNIGKSYIWISGSAFGQNAYVSLDGTRTISTVTASYNAAGDLVYTGVED